MKDFLTQIAIYLFSLFGVIVLVNYFGDRAHLFDSGYENKIVNILLKGNNATDINNYNDRYFRKDYIENFNKEIDIVILGSSRTIMI